MLTNNLTWVSVTKTIYCESSEVCNLLWVNINFATVFMRIIATVFDPFFIQTV